MAVIDADPFSVAGIRCFLQRWLPRLAICAEFTSIVAAESQIEVRRPDLVILDPEMDGGRGFDVLRKWVKSRQPWACIARITRRDPRLILSALKAGARAVVLRSEFQSALELAIENSVCGRPFLSHEAAALLSGVHLTEAEEHSEPARDMERLSVREQEIFLLLSLGVSVPDIARQLGKSHKTVQAQCQSIRHKLGVSDQPMLCRRAIRYYVYASWRGAGGIKE